MSPSLPSPSAISAEWTHIHSDFLLRPSICQGVINCEEGQQRIKPRNSLKLDHYYCSLQRPALSSSPKAKESIFLICSRPSSLLGRIDVSDIWNHKLTRGRIKMKKLHFAVGLDEHIWLMAISCCILCWLWLCKNFKLKFQMTEQCINSQYNEVLQDAAKYILRQHFPLYFELFVHVNKLYLFICTCYFSLTGLCACTDQYCILNVTITYKIHIQVSFYVYKYKWPHKQGLHLHRSECGDLCKDICHHP